MQELLGLGQLLPQDSHLRLIVYDRLVRSSRNKTGLRLLLQALKRAVKKNLTAAWDHYSSPCDLSPS
jgi:hypothetical protein